MNIHMLSIVPLFVGVLLLFIGSAPNSWTIIIPGFVFILWGMIIHGNNIKVIRNCRQNPKWRRNRT